MVDFRRIKRCKYEELCKKDQKYVDAFIETGCKFLAYEKAGYSIKGRAWKVNANNKFREVSFVIEERIDTKVGQGAIMALGIIEEIMKDESVSPAVRLSCAKDYLSRAGRDTPVTQKVEITDSRELETKELNEEILSILGEKNESKPGSATGTKH